MPTFVFDMGNSNRGSIGYVAYVNADTRAAAVEKLKEARNVSRLAPTRTWTSGSISTSAPSARAGRRRSDVEAS